jgi:predicted HicB family RNase H-like nuclease
MSEPSRLIEETEIDLHIPDEMHARLIAEANRRGVPLSELIILLLNEGLK